MPNNRVNSSILDFNQELERLCTNGGCGKLSFFNSSLTTETSGLANPSLACLDCISLF